MGRANHPCDPLSRWRNFAFSRKEGDRAVIDVQVFEATYNSANDAYATIKLNGHARTAVSPDLAFDAGSQYTFEYNKEYEMVSLSSLPSRNRFDSANPLVVVSNMSFCPTVLYA